MLGWVVENCAGKMALPVMSQNTQRNPFFFTYQTHHLKKTVE